jgi:hypothetical protein
MTMVTCRVDQRGKLALRNEDVAGP